MSTTPNSSGTFTTYSSTCVRRTVDVSPEQWKYKKRKDRSDCGDYRGIWRVAHFRQFFTENGGVFRLSITIIARPKGHSPRNSAAFARHDLQSTCCPSCADCKNSDELEFSPRVHKYMCFIDLQRTRNPVDRGLLRVVLARFGATEIMHPPVSRSHASSRAYG